MNIDFELHLCTISNPHPGLTPRTALRAVNWLGDNNSLLRRSIFFTTNQQNSRNLIRYNLANENETILDDNVTRTGTHLAVDTTNKTSTVYWILFTSEANYKIYKTIIMRAKQHRLDLIKRGVLTIQILLRGMVTFISLIQPLHVVKALEIRKYDKATDTVASTISLAHEISRIIIVAGRYVSIVAEK